MTVALILIGAVVLAGSVGFLVGALLAGVEANDRVLAALRAADRRERDLLAENEHLQRALYEQRRRADSAEDFLAVVSP